MSITAATLITRIGVQGADAAKREINSFSDSLTNVARGAGAAGGMLSAGLTAPLLAASVAILKTGIDFESAFTGVIKTVNATDAQLADLRAGIRDMSKELPSSAVEIAAVAEAAGQLGIETENILGFTRVMIDLGETTNLSATQAATDLARLANITGMSQKDFDRLGSTIVALGNNLATTEAEIVAMAMRLAGAGSQIGLTEAQILGLAGALSSVGIEAEAGGTAISRVMIDMAQSVATGDAKLALFAETAGMTVSAFVAAFEQDAAGALVTFIEGLGNLDAAGGNVFATLEALGLSEVRVRDALLRASGAGDLFRQSLELGSKAWEENIALTQEAELRYGTTASQIEIMRNRVTDLGVTLFDTFKEKINAGIGGLDSLVTSIEGLVTSFATLDPGMQSAILAFAGVMAAAGPVLLIIAGVSAALAFMLSPIGLVILAVGALAAAWASDFGGIQEITTAGVAGITASLKSLEASLDPVQSALDNWLATGLPAELAAMQADWDATWGAVQAKTAEAGAVLTPIFDSIDAWFAVQLAEGLTTARTDWATTLGGFVTNATATQTALTPIFAAIRAAIGAEMKRELAVMQADWESTWSQLAFKATDTQAALQPVFDAIVVGLATSIPAALTAVQADWDATWTAMAAKVTDVWDKVQQFFAWLNLTGMFAGVVGSGGGGVGMGAIVQPTPAAPESALRTPWVKPSELGGPGIWGGGAGVGGFGGTAATAAVTALVWADYVEPLVWADFVEGIIWEEIIPSFKWLNYVYVLNWANYVMDISWGEFIKDMKWSSYVSDLSWGQFVPTLNWGAFIPSMGAGGGGGSSGAGAAPGSGAPGDPLLATPPASSPWDVYPTASAAGVTVQITGPVNINNGMDIESLADQVIRAMRRRM